MELMALLIVVGSVLGAIVLLIVVISTNDETIDSRERVAETDLQMRIRTKAFVDEVINNRRLEPVECLGIGMKPGERAYWKSPAIMMETRTVRHYQSGSAGIRVAKGVYIGGTRGHSSPVDQWQEIDRGTIYVTNKRIVFDASKLHRNLELKKIVAYEHGRDGVRISVENRQKSMYFVVNDPGILAVVISICMRVSDPDMINPESLKINVEIPEIEASTSDS